MADEYNQEEADERHRRRRSRLQDIRNNLTRIVDDYYNDFPESERGEGGLEYRIEQRLREVQRSMDDFIEDFRRESNS